MPSGLRTVRRATWPTKLCNRPRPAPPPAKIPVRPAIALAARRRPKRGAAGRASRHDRGLRRRLWHHRLWRLRLVHERQHDPDRLPGRRGRFRPGVGIGAGDPVLLHRHVCGRIVRADPAGAGAAPCLRLRSGDARGDHRPDATGVPVDRFRHRDRQFRDGRLQQRALPRRRASGKPHLRHRNAEPRRIASRAGGEARAA